MNKNIELEIETEVSGLERGLSEIIKICSIGSDVEQAEDCANDLLKKYTEKKIGLIKKSNSEILNFENYDKRVSDIYERFLEAVGLP